MCTISVVIDEADPDIKYSITHLRLIWPTRMGNIRWLEKKTVISIKSELCYWLESFAGHLRIKNWSPEKPHLLPRPLNSTSYMWTCENAHTQGCTQSPSSCVTQTMNSQSLTHTHTQWGHPMSHALHCKKCHFLRKIECAVLLKPPPFLFPS